ncbi:MAG: NAD-binding protein, partial [Rhodospirillaceae bacterium]|nr:NAD-binding protein [Rhodospirillaceae bacterium]
RDLVVTGALFSILINPFFFLALDRRLRRSGNAAEPRPAPSALPPWPGASDGHAVVIGYGRVGRAIVQDLAARGLDVIVVDDRDDIVEAEGPRTTTVRGNGASAELLARCDLARAGRLFVAIPNSFEAGQIVQQARALNPRLGIIARAHSDPEVAYLQKCGANATIMGEREIAAGMIARAFAA